MRGGYRQGAGRKQGFAAKNAEEARRLLSERVAQEIGPLCDALIKKAKSGDIRAIHELFDRAWGKAPQNATIDLSDDRLPTPIIQISKEAAERYGISPIYGGLSSSDS